MTETILSAKARRERNREEMKAAILATARDIIRTDGAAALSLHEVARRIGLQTPSLYAYFEGKPAVYDALFRLGVRLYSERLEQVYTQTPPGWEQIEAASAAILDFACECPDLYQIVFERPVPGFIPSAEALAESVRAYERSRDMFAQALAQAGIRPGLPVTQAFDLLVATIHGLAAQHLANEPHLAPGSGRFGGLVAAAVAVFRAAWGPLES